MKNLTSIVLTAALFAIGQSSSPGASVFTETFSTLGNVEGWQTAGFGLALSNSGSALSFTAPDSYVFDLISADATASGGAFAGNYTTAQIGSLSLDFSLAAASDLSKLSLSLKDNGGNQWDYDLPILPGGIQSYTASILSDTGWTQITGSDSFATLLTDISSASLSFEEGITSPEGVSGSVDNFRTNAVPEPASLALLVPAFFVFAARHRRLTSHRTAPAR